MANATTTEREKRFCSAFTTSVKMPFPVALLLAALAGPGAMALALPCGGHL